MSSRAALTLLSAVLVACVVAAAAAVLGLQAGADRATARVERFEEVQRHAHTASSSAVAALRRVTGARAVLHAERLVAATARLERAHPDDLLVVTVDWAASRMLEAVRAEEAALDDYAAEEANTIVVGQVAMAHDRVQRLLEDARAREVAVAAATTRRADRLSALVLVALLVVVGAVAAAWLTLRRRADLAAFSRTRARTFAALSRNASDAVTVIDADGIVETQAGATETVLGRDPAAVVGMAFCDLVHPDDRDRFATLLERGLIEWRVAHPDGTCLDVETRATDLRRDPNVRGLVLTTHDISGRKALEQTLRHRASHDPLTALPNRALFHERLEAALDPAAADGIAVLYVDLDGFKGVNDRLGHAAGDEVLVAAAERLRGCVRAEDTVARLGGDEFALLLGVGPEHPDPADVAERVLAAFTRPVATGAGEVVMAPSIGIARPDERRTGVDDVVRAADAAMYLAKRAGGARYAEAGPAGSALVGAA